MTGDDDTIADRNRRRALLAAQANPAPWHDYGVRWTGTLADGTRLAVDFVPDRLVLVPDSFAAFLAALETGSWPGLEALVLAVLDDFNNELVPRWVQVAAWRQTGRANQLASADDRQPDWDNPALLARLEAVPAER